MAPSDCPCGSNLPFSQCCGPCLDDTRPANTAEQLMRSRYTAYVLQNEEYLFQTWHHSTRPSQLSLNQEPVPKWLGLQILNTLSGGETDNDGKVEFMARYKLNGRALRLHENSRFIKQAGRWYYLDGEVLD